MIMNIYKIINLNLIDAETAVKSRYESVYHMIKDQPYATLNVDRYAANDVIEDIIKNISLDVYNPNINYSGLDIMTLIVDDSRCYHGVYRKTRFNSLDEFRRMCCATDLVYDIVLDEKDSPICKAFTKEQPFVTMSHSHYNYSVFDMENFKGVATFCTLDAQCRIYLSKYFNGTKEYYYRISDSLLLKHNDEICFIDKIYTSVDVKPSEHYPVQVLDMGKFKFAVDDLSPEALQLGREFLAGLRSRELNSYIPQNLSMEATAESRLNQNLSTESTTDSRLNQNPQTSRKRKNGCTCKPTVKLVCQHCMQERYALQNSCQTSQNRQTCRHCNTRKVQFRRESCCTRFLRWLRLA